MSILKPIAIAALGVMLLALTLAACSGDTATPDTRMQGGVELTTEEYAEALEGDHRRP